MTRLDPLPKDVPFGLLVATHNFKRLKPPKAPKKEAWLGIFQRNVLNNTLSILCQTFTNITIYSRIVNFQMILSMTKYTYIYKRNVHPHLMACKLEHLLKYWDNFVLMPFMTCAPPRTLTSLSKNRTILTNNPSP